MVSSLDAAIQAVMLEPNDYLTVVIDTVDWAEKYILDKICRAKKVNDITDFAHGHGYTLLRDAFDKFLLELNGFCRRGKHVVLIGHAQVKIFSSRSRGTVRSMGTEVR